jgi:hypothetical protein
VLLVLLVLLLARWLGRLLGPRGLGWLGGLCMPRGCQAMVWASGSCALGTGGAVGMVRAVGTVRAVVQGQVFYLYHPYKENKVYPCKGRGIVT